MYLSDTLYFIFHEFAKVCTLLLSGCRVTHAVDNAFTSSHGRACIRTGEFMENIRLFYVSCEHHALESILSMAQGHIVHLLLVFFPFSSPSDVILSFSCGSLLLYFVFTSCHGCI